MDCGFPKKGTTERRHHQDGFEADPINEGAVTKAGNVARGRKGNGRRERWFADRENGTEEEESVVRGARVVECARVE